MGDKFRAFWLGVFIVGACVGAAWILLFLRPSVGDNETKLRVRFSNIDRIFVGSRVNFAGKPVGEVAKIKEIKNARSSGDVDAKGDIYIYELELKVDSSVHIFTYDEISFTSSGLLGERSIAITPRAALAGMPSPEEVTGEILYADSEDKLEEMIGYLGDVAETFDKAMGQIGDFFEKNKEEMEEALTHFSAASKEASTLFARMNHTRFDQAIDNIALITDHISSGQGTLGRIVFDDGLYKQLSGTLGEIETTFGSINRYGLFFQFTGGWRREMREKRYQQPLAGMEKAGMGTHAGTGTVWDCAKSLLTK